MTNVVRGETRHVTTRQPQRTVIFRGSPGPRGRDGATFELTNGDVVELTKGVAIYISALGVMQRAVNNDPTKCRVSGFVADGRVPIGTSGSVQTNGVCPLFAGLVAGTYYLDSAPGAITSDAPARGSGLYQCVLGEALSATTLDFKREPPFQV